MSSQLFSRRQVAGLGAVMGAMLLCVYLLSSSQAKPIRFQTLREFKDFALSKGLFFPEQPIVLDNCFIADHRLHGDASRVLQSLDKRDCGLTPAWRGLLWVCALQSRFESEFQSSTVGGKSRIWGSLLVAGDEELMNRIEHMVRGQ